MSGPEERTRRALASLPGPSAEATDRARRAALDALPEAAPRPRRPRRWALAAGLAAALAVATAGIALAATGRLEVRIGSDTPSERAAGRSPAAPPVGRIALPEGVNGIAAVAGGRLWMASRTGFRVEDLAVSAAELSPNATYAAVGIGRSLVVLDPAGRRPWSLPVDGRVVAAAWRPNPLPTEIAYVVRRAGHHELHVVQADGDGDRLIDPSVAPVRPSWRSDAPSVAYVTASGDLRIRDLARGTATTIPSARGVQAVAYAPVGPGIAWLQRPGAVGFAHLGKGMDGVVPNDGDRPTAIAWTSVGGLATAGRRPDGLWQVRLDDLGEPVREPIGPIAADARGRLAVSLGGELRLAETPDRGGASLGASPVLLRLPPGLRVQALSLR